MTQPERIGKALPIMPKIDAIRKDDEFYDDESNEGTERLRAETMQIFGSGLQKLVDEQVGLKEELERRWLDDLRHYNGKPDSETEAKIKKSGNSNQSTIFVNLTRVKSNTAEAKWADLLLPTDDRNWGIKPTPVPSLVKALDSAEYLQLVDGRTPVNPESGETYKQKDLAKEIMDAARTSAEGMQSEIDDQLVESRYNSLCRDIIHDATSLGTGILKGPMVKKRARKAWTTDESGQWVLNTQEEFRPFVERTDPWNFFPDMSAISSDDLEFIFERHMLTKKQVRKLANRPGFIKTALQEILQKGPSARRSDISYLNHLREINGITQIHNDNRYELWEYHGPIDKDNLISCGCNGIDPEDNLQEYQGVVWFSEGVVVKASLNHMDDDSLPYSILNWEKDETSVFGFGVPYRMRDPQRVMNASWRMVLDNAGLSTGPQICINKKIVEPADGQWTLTPRKLWWLKDPKMRVEDAFGTFEINSHQQELSAIFEQAHRLADEETGVPQIQMGQQPEGTQQPAYLKTLGGTALWMTASNIMMRNAVKNFDDDLTVPFINRMYDWNMQFNQNNDIKGDYTIDARGTSVLLEREMKSRNLLEFVTLAQNIPGGLERLKEKGLLEEMAKALSVNADDFIKSDEEMDPEEGEEPQQDTEVMKMQMQMQIAQMGLQEKQIEAEAMMQREMVQREVEMTKIATDQQMSMAELTQKYGLEKYKVDWSAKQFYDEIGIKQRMGETANYGLGQ